MFQVLDNAKQVVSSGYSQIEAIQNFLNEMNKNPFGARLSWNNYLKCGYSVYFLG